MAQRILDWAVKGSELVMSKYNGKDVPNEELTKFDILEVFPGFNEMTEVQKFIVEYGFKQKLSDGGSSVNTADEKVAIAKEKFKMFVDGKLTGVRLNATGAKENKRIAEAVRNTAKVVSLEGLLIKKATFPDQFTDEDQVKLNEFLVIVAGHGKGK